jgi:integrase
MPKIGRTDEAKTYAYSETETKQIRDAVRKHIAEEHRDLASTLLILGSYTSLSKSELAGLDWEDVRASDKGSHSGRFWPEPVIHPREPRSTETQ